MSKLLLVDDDETVRNMLQEALVRAGYEVEAVADGKAALRAQRERPADLIITDIVMPEMDGTEAIMELRRLDPNVKIIAISGGGRNRPELMLMVARKLGAQVTLTKPFTQKEILDAIASLLGGPP